ncbi:hypothetical protein AX15_006539 [Amanita polypyramis BW_CC]|nr:hypothetical protein AX15_006539 [Amanita polypyramis BW_CC]
MCPNRTTFFNGMCFACSSKRVGVGDVHGVTRDPIENHGTRALSEDNERPLRGVNSVLDVAVDNEPDVADVAEWSDTIEWLIDDDEVVLFGNFSEENVFRVEDAEIGREGGREIECVECRVGCVECCGEFKGRMCGVREM